MEHPEPSIAGLVAAGSIVDGPCPLAWTAGNQPSRGARCCPPVCAHQPWGFTCFCGTCSWDRPRPPHRGRVCRDEAARPPHPEENTSRPSWLFSPHPHTPWGERSLGSTWASALPPQVHASVCPADPNRGRRRALSLDRGNAPSHPACPPEDFQTLSLHGRATLEGG